MLSYISSLRSYLPCCVWYLTLPIETTNKPLGMLPPLRAWYQGPHIYAESIDRQHKVEKSNQWNGNVITLVYRDLPGLHSKDIPANSKENNVKKYQWLSVRLQ